MTREQANKANELIQNIQDVENMLYFINKNDNIAFTDGDRFIPSRRMLNSDELNTRLKTVIIDALTTMSKELEDKLAKL